MSINVNVTGNPVRIHRGKMVTANPDYAKEEFQKRRRMRMEQVRQQSKDIAESVRNKVKNEQNKHLSDLERRGENELKKWQTRKLLRLQEQYRECLKDIGLGHSEAVLEEESDYAMESRKESYDQAAKERGFRAAEKLQRQKNEENLHKEAGLQKRTYNQAIENTRAKLIADLNKKKNNKSPFKKKKRKVRTDINIFSRLSGGSDCETDVPELLNISSSSSRNSSSEREIVKKSTNRKDPTPASRKSTESTDPISKHRYANRCVRENICGRRVSSPTEPKVSESKEIKRNSINYSADTRISDRIKSRTILGDSCDPQTCDMYFPMDSNQARESVLIQSEQSKQFSPPPSPKKNSGVCEDSCLAKCNTSKRYTKTDTKDIPNNTSKERLSKEEIPNKPTITIRTGKESTNQSKTCGQSSCNFNKVQYYDHKHRFSKKLIPDTSSVQRIPEESIEVCPSSRSEAEFQEQMCKRDQEAQHRGQKALQKEKVHRDYKEMMQQLPGLQKQEKIASIPSKKPAFHMSEERLKHREKKKQNQMENAYEKLFPKARIITIPPKKQNKPPTSTSVLPFQTIDVTEPSLNVGSWDIEAKPKFTCCPKNVESELIKETTKKVFGEPPNLQREAQERKENLQDMLKSLKFHRDKLVKELSSLPESDNRQKLFGELGHIDKLISMGQNVDMESSSGGKRQSRSRTKLRGKINTSNSSGSPSRLETVREESEKRTDGRNISKYHVRCTSGSSSSPSPPPKILNKAKRKTSRPPPLILQNTSTQTTPTVMPTEDKRTETLKPSHKKTGPCDCCLRTGSEKNDLCQIVIKISEDGKPEVCVDPSKLNDREVIVKSKKEKIPSPQLPKSKSPPLEKLKPKSPPKLKSPKKQKVDQTKQKKKREKPKAEEKKMENKNYTQKSPSWREYLSQNSTASTSYLSPPDFTSTRAQIPGQNYEAPKPPGYLMNILRDKPQQNNIQAEPYILCYIKRLLMMSRRSIDDLTVSSVSEISTPGSSIINIQSNVSTQQLDDFMKYFNINMSELQEFLNCSPDGSNLHYNTPENLSVTPTVDFSKSPCSNDCTENVQDSRFNNYTNQAYPGVLSAYNKLAENCAKKIENLAAMIEKVRLEKINMLQSPGSGSDKENSTKYLDLPTGLRKTSEGRSPSRGSPRNSKSPSPNSKSPSRNSSTLEQEELDRQLLEIDYSFAERLKKMTTEEIRKQYPSPESDEHQDSMDQDLMRRYKNLLESYKNDSKPVLDENSNCPCPPKQNSDTPFVPLLRDIPRLPKLEVPPTIGLHRNNDKSKPPPSKGISVAKRFNNDLNMVPHELSAIPESESLISCRLQKSKTTESQGSSLQTSPEQGKKISCCPKRMTLSEEAFNNPQTSSTSGSLTSLPDILGELMKNVSKEANNATCRPCEPSANPPINVIEVQSDSSSDLENMESMLKSLGMGWAITTLRKTQEALALTSSSSSIDISVARKDMKLSDTSTPSDFSIKEVLGQELTTKLSSTSYDSSGSYSFLRGFQGLSALYGAEVCREAGRTSTPIQSSRSVDKSKSESQPQITLTEESEISFPKENTDRSNNNCDCVPFYSLNESSIKSKSSSKDD